MTRPRLRPFDLLGIASMVVFAAVLFTELDELAWSGHEVALSPEPDQVASGFRPGVSWYGLYLGDDKVGFSRLERRRRRDGYAVRSQTVLTVPVMGTDRPITVALEADLDPHMALRTFDATVIGDPLSVTARGSWRDGELVLDVRAGDLEDHRRLSLERPPAIDANLRTLLMRSHPRPGERFRFDYFDPLSLTTRTLDIEYMGIDRLALVDDVVTAHRLRQRVAGVVFRSWVNDVGEVLRQELPLGVVLVRGTEAEASSGLDLSERGHGPGGGGR
jgi:hypothetical protein